ncbi:hypothetical protein EZZ81_26695 [Pseudomonas viridiflava]|uniref:Uncharacterized protein n=1 Tax=Pseudomonas viridiflava TaxID=33069 RepID=A0AA46ZY76_PSEVI|nr:hypothetical protein EZZ81_26695 [Pseudomonas viridiflava]
MTWMTLELGRAFAPHSRADAERPGRHSHAEHGNDHCAILIVPMLRVGMHPVTLRVTNGTDWGFSKPSA